MEIAPRNTALFAGLACLLLLPHPAGSEAPLPTAAEVVSAVPGARAEDVLAGKTVLKQARESDSREMSVALVCLIPPGREASLAPFHRGGAVHPDRHRDDEGTIDVADIEGSLQALSIDSVREARRYLKARPGWELSLSAEEIAAFNALRPAPGQELEAVNAELRRALARRVRDYRARGLPGIAPFDRGGGQISSPGDDLRNSTLASKGIQRVAPRIHEALLRFPLPGPPGARDFYFWTRVRISDRPVFLLHHRVAADFGDRSAVIERQFYATQFFSVGQMLIALVPVQEGTLAFYVNKAFVDRWSGPRLGTGAKRAVGLKLMNETLREMAKSSGLCAGGA